jgi:hypothetical protein
MDARACADGVSESEWVAMGGDKGLVGMSACGRVPIVWALLKTCLFLVDPF